MLHKKYLLCKINKWKHYSRANSTIKFPTPRLPRNTKIIPWFYINLILWNCVIRPLGGTSSRDHTKSTFYWSELSGDRYERLVASEYNFPTCLLQVNCIFYPSLLVASELFMSECLKFSSVQLFILLSYFVKFILFFVKNKKYKFNNFFLLSIKVYLYAQRHDFFVFHLLLRSVLYVT